MFQIFGEMTKYPTRPGVSSLRHMSIGHLKEIDLVFAMLKDHADDLPEEVLAKVNPESRKCIERLEAHRASETRE